MPAISDLRGAVADLSTLAAGDLEILWRQAGTPALARELLLDVLPQLVDTYGLAAASVAADWYEEARDEAGARGRFTPITADTVNAGTDELARWAVGPLFQEVPDWQRAATLVSGGLQRRIANAARDTITTSSIEDPGADGWQRAGDGSTCPFCRMLIGRGAVYSERGASFGSHDDCGCVAVPAFGGSPRPVAPYRATDRETSDADRARVRAWMVANQ